MGEGQSLKRQIMTTNDILKNTARERPDWEGKVSIEFGYFHCVDTSVNRHVFGVLALESEPIDPRL
jgi:hypothetical protein